MKKFLSEILLFLFLPVLCITVMAEYSLRHIPNDYSYKNHWIETNCKNLKILCLGPSSIYFGINPIYFDRKTFNGAHVSQSLNYDNFIFNKFIKNMDSLQFIILGIDYWAPYYSLENGEESWRVKNYAIYYGCDYHKLDIKYNYELSIHNISTFKRAGKSFLTLIGLKHYSEININELGFGINYSSKNKLIEWDNGKEYAIRHNREIKTIEHLNLIDKNQEYVSDICKKCADRNIKVLIISTPTYKTYQANLDNDYLRKKNNFCEFFVKTFKNVSYIDFSSDSRFVDKDFFDGCHLNEIGASKLTKLINTKILEWK
jgi:hypothetical protein